MFGRKPNGAVKTKNSTIAKAGTKIGVSAVNVDRILTADQATRKKFYSRFNWFHDRSKISSRQTAETKLKLSKGGASSNGSGEKKKGAKDGKTGNKDDILFLLRCSMICDDDFILSYIAGDGKCYHFNITLRPDTGQYVLESVSSPGGRALFHGLNDLIDTLQKRNDCLTQILTRPCPDGDSPPPETLSHGYTNPLHEYINKENAEMALAIIQHENRPPLNERDAKGNMALHLAVKAGMKDVVDALVENDVSVAAVDELQNTALQLACKSSACTDGYIARVLLERGGADSQCRHAETGDVALHMAAAAGHLECIRVLLARHVPIWVRNYAKKTPYELAKERGHEACAQELDYYKVPPATSIRSQWFHAGINREQSESLLNNQGCRDGLFLVRTSSREKDRFILDVCFHQRVKHYVIETNPQQAVFFIQDGPLFSSLEHLIDYYVRYTDGLDCRLSCALSSEGTIVVVTPTTSSNSAAPVPARDRPSTAAEPQNLDRSRISIGVELGQGEYGSVMQGTWTEHNGKVVRVAIKTLNPEHVVNGKDGFLREAQVMVKLDHPCIVKLIGISQGQPLMLVQELLAMGSLLDFLLDYPEQVDTEKDLHLWAGQIAYGMSYLEKQLLVHRDLAARNILLESKSQVKICDFGLSRAIGHNDYYRATHGGKWPVKWYAPEAMNYGTFSSASDVWSYGVTLWEMFSKGEQPYEEMTGSQVLQMIEHKGRLKQPPYCPANIYKIMMRCWEYKPADRPTFGELHKIFQRAQKYENISEA